MLTKGLQLNKKLERAQARVQELEARCNLNSEAEMAAMRRQLQELQEVRDLLQGQVKGLQDELVEKANISAIQLAQLSDLRRELREQQLQAKKNERSKRRRNRPDYFGSQ